MREEFQDLAIALAWPQQTARGDEKWMRFLKGLKIIEDLNFRVGHAAILLLQRKTGRVVYYDFGRYICPRGMGRARSIDFDPNLVLRTTAIWRDGKLDNLQSILEELHDIRQYTHGEGVIYAGIAEGISFEKGCEYADSVVNQGFIPYGAFALNNNNCSRYVAQIMGKAMSNVDSRRRRLLFPNTIKPSPISNVVYANEKNEVYIYENDKLSSVFLKPRKALSFLVKQLVQSFRKDNANTIAEDHVVGELLEPERPSCLPGDAQWLGGIGEGAWLCLEVIEGYYLITKFDKIGEKLYQVKARCNRIINSNDRYSFSYNFSVNKHILVYQDFHVTLDTCEVLFIKNNYKRDEIKYFKVQNSHG